MTPVALGVSRLSAPGSQSSRFPLSNSQRRGLRGGRGPGQLAHARARGAHGGWRGSPHGARPAVEEDRKVAPTSSLWPVLGAPGNELDCGTAGNEASTRGKGLRGRGTITPVFLGRTRRRGWRRGEVTCRSPGGHQGQPLRTQLGPEPLLFPQAVPRSSRLAGGSDLGGQARAPRAPRAQVSALLSRGLTRAPLLGCPR